MKVLEIVTGRSSRLFRVSHPKGALPIATLIEAVQNRYNFLGLPENVSEILSNSVAVFQQGAFNDHVVKRLAVGECFFACDVHGTTAAADEVADDIENWIITTLGYQRKDDGVTARGYASEIEFSMQPVESAPLAHFALINRFIGGLVRSYGNDSPDYSLERVAFIPEPSVAQSLRTIPFAVERRVGVPFAKEVWYSAAPLRTDDHIALLQMYAEPFERPT